MSYGTGNCKEREVYIRYNGDILFTIYYTVNTQRDTISFKHEWLIKLVEFYDNDLFDLNIDEIIEKKKTTKG